MRNVAPSRLGALAALAALATASVPSCSLGTGSGQVTGSLDAPDCWSGPFVMNPTFFAAVPYSVGTVDTLELRIQDGSDLEAFSDGIEILIDDLATIRGDSTHPSLYGQPLTVSLPAGVAAPGVPIVANPDPSTVHFTLYLQSTCQTENVALYGLDSVSLTKDGLCDGHDLADGGGAEVVCPGSALGLADAGSADGAPAGSATDGSVGDGGASEGGTEEGGTSSAPIEPPVGHSTITFTSLFDGNPAEVSAAERLNEGTFDVYLGDPRDACPGGVGPPPPCRGHLKGYFKFYFLRGRPAQPFP